MAGLLAYLTFQCPSRSDCIGTVDAVIEKLRYRFRFTATGIAPDLHRTSLLIPFCGNQYAANVGLIQHLL